jgi:hypothetical protein
VFSCQIGTARFLQCGVINPRFDENETRFFSSFGGSSWHRADVAFIFWVSSLPTRSDFCVGGKTLDVINIPNNFCHPLDFRSSILSLKNNIVQLLSKSSRVEKITQE